MHARLNPHTASRTAQQIIKSLAAADQAVARSTLPAIVAELVKIRASQINGCAFCVDMHTKDARAAGESELRVHLVAVWREAPVFTDAERAALDVAEQGSRIADGGQVSDQVWARAAEHYDEDQLGALVGQIAVINAFNTVNVITQNPAIDYQPGQFG